MRSAADANTGAPAARGRGGNPPRHGSRAGRRRVVAPLPARIDDPDRKRHADLGRRPGRDAEEEGLGGRARRRSRRAPVGPGPHEGMAGRSGPPTAAPFPSTTAASSNGSPATRGAASTPSPTATTACPWTTCCIDPARRRRADRPGRRLHQRDQRRPARDRGRRRVEARPRERGRRDRRDHSHARHARPRSRPTRASSSTTTTPPRSSAPATSSRSSTRPG